MKKKLIIIAILKILIISYPVLCETARFNFSWPVKKQGSVTFSYSIQTKQSFFKKYNHSVIATSNFVIQKDLSKNEIFYMSFDKFSLIKNKSNKRNRTNYFHLFANIDFFPKLILNNKTKKISFYDFLYYRNTLNEKLLKEQTYYTAKTIRKVQEKILSEKFQSNVFEEFQMIFFYVLWHWENKKIELGKFYEKKTKKLFPSISKERLPYIYTYFFKGVNKARIVTTQLTEYIDPASLKRALNISDKKFKQKGYFYRKVHILSAESKTLIPHSYKEIYEYKLPNNEVKIIKEYQFAY